LQSKKWLGVEILVTFTDITSTIKTQLENLGYSPYLGAIDFSIPVPFNQRALHGYHAGTKTYYVIIPADKGGNTVHLLVAIRRVNGSWRVVGVLEAVRHDIGLHVTDNYIYVCYKPTNTETRVVKCDPDLNVISTLYTDTAYEWLSIYVDEANDLLLLFGRFNIDHTGETGEIAKVKISTGEKTTLKTGTFFFSPYIKVGNKLYVGGHGGMKAIVDISNPANPTVSDWTGFSFTFSVLPLYYDPDKNRILVAELGSGTGATQALLWYYIDTGNVEYITKPSGYAAAGVNLIGKVGDKKLLLAFGVPYGANGPVGLFVFNVEDNSFEDVSITINGKKACGQSSLVSADITSLDDMPNIIVTKLYVEGSQSNTVNNYIYYISGRALTTLTLTVTPL